MNIWLATALSSCCNPLQQNQTFKSYTVFWDVFFQRRENRCSFRTLPSYGRYISVNSASASLAAKWWHLSQLSWAGCWSMGSTSGRLQKVHFVSTLEPSKRWRDVKSIFPPIPHFETYPFWDVSVRHLPMHYNHDQIPSSLAVKKPPWEGLMSQTTLCFTQSWMHEKRLWALPGYNKPKQPPPQINSRYQYLDTNCFFSSI